MMRVALVYQSEGAALLERDLVALGMTVVEVRAEDAEETLREAGADAVVVEAGPLLDEARRLVESIGREVKAPVVVLVRPDQVPGVDASWPMEDFLVLPVSAEELALRLKRAVWRKTGVDTGSLLRVGELTVDMANYKVFVAEQPVSLTYKEFELLRFLLVNRGKVFTREALLNRVWGYEYYGGARTVDVHVRRLRSKIEVGSTVYIETVRNVGYRFQATLAEQP